MTAYCNPKHGDDATAEMDSRARPWQTHAAAIAALEAARASALAELASSSKPYALQQTFNLVETHKPLPAET